MNSRQATINKVLTFSCVDGPGNRLVVFFQGCNFACKACHNPYTIGVCNHCGDCIPACHAGALSLVDGRIAYDRALCDDCDDCLVACPISASPMTRDMRVADILETARANLDFLTGITVSGGEATLQLKFVQALFQAVKDDAQLAHLTCFIDSNGHLGAKGWNRLLRVTDGVMLDIKAFSPGLHRRMTGQDNVKVLQSAQILWDAGKLYEIRILLVPGQTDREAELASLVDFATALGPELRIRLNAFQHHGVTGVARGWPKMDRDGVERVAARLVAAGFPNVVTPVLYQ